MLQKTSILKKLYSENIITVSTKILSTTTVFNTDNKAAFTPFLNYRRLKIDNM